MCCIAFHFVQSGGLATDLSLDPPYISQGPTTHVFGMSVLQRKPDNALVFYTSSYEAGAL